MSRFNRLPFANLGSRILPSFLGQVHGSRGKPPFLPTQSSCQRASNRFLDFYQVGNKAAIEKERARINDEMSRGYFADMSELKQHGGKIAAANKVLIPSVAAVKFPEIQVEVSGGSVTKLPVSCNQDLTNKSTPYAAPKVTLMCLSFRASSQAMVSSWSMPFCDAFRDADNIHVYEVSFIDSWLLCRQPIKNLLLRVMRKSKNQEGEVSLKRRVVYSFGDNYYFRKELRILNLLTGYIYLLDRFGRVRWQGFGLASPEELSSLKSCTSLLLAEK
ncbi:hypothetical protein MLD38_003480 [Melastoma candidum]|uniref:Uncharacterized protein n=1 Tax=Melastoma candidum TaxID=119954 RepID=A0ACB9S425_9MYRT|nr:hypothetical protein MLD38_003480 [Melastoma candidum]